MQANEPITIRRAQNGFIVFGVANLTTTSDFVGDDTMVFNTMEYLQHFLKEHFRPSQQCGDYDKMLSGLKKMSDCPEYGSPPLGLIPPKPSDDF